MANIVFNDISLSYHSKVSFDEAGSVFEQFVEAIGALIDEGLANSILRSQICMQDAEISTTDGVKWHVSEWLHDNNVDREFRSFLLSLDTKIPIEQDLKLSDEQEDALISYEYRANAMEGPDCYSIGFALHTGDIVASIQTNPIWDTSQLVAQVCSEGKILRTITVDHISCDEHCSQLANLFNERAYQSTGTPAELKATKEVLFQNIRFSPDVDGQIDQLECRNISNVLEKLQKIDATARDWKSSQSDSPVYKFRWRGESLSTMANSQYRSARTFRLPSGEKSIFENHIDFTDRHRIHYIEDRANRTFIIGYIGDHLPTVLYPH